MKVVYYVAASLDGFIADREQGVGWLDQLSINQEATGCEEFFASVDGLLMGRSTFDFVFNYGQWPYEDKPTWVCSQRDVPHLDGCNLQPERGPVDAIEQASRQGLNVLWMVGGGRLATFLLQQRLLTHLSVSVMPVILGSGVSLVHALPKHQFLRQENSQSTSGFTQIEYRIDG